MYNDGDSLKRQKHKSRKFLRKRLQNLSVERKQEESVRITELLKSMDIVKEAEVILGYLSFGDELDIDQFLLWAMESGKEVFVPCISCIKGIAGPSIMTFHQIHHLTEGLSKNRFGIREPDLKTASAYAPSPETKAVMIVPGLGFDSSGHRLGRGGGYYDAFLEQNGTYLVKIGVACSEQVLNDIPAGDADARVDFLVSHRILYFNRDIS